MYCVGGSRVTAARAGQGGAQGHGSRVKRGEAWSRDTPTPHQPHCTAITVHNTQPSTFTHVELHISCIGRPEDIRVIGNR